MKKLSLFTTGVLLVLCLFVLSGCSSKIIKEKEVFEDIKKSDAYCSTFDFTYDSMEIVKRMTDEEEKKDDVYVNFKCHNDDFEYIVECIVHYVLYNEGWIFENYEILNSSYNALTTPSETNVIEDFNYIKFEEIEEDIALNLNDDNGSNKYWFLAHSKEQISEYFTWDNNHCIFYEFTPETGWIGEIIETDQFENWNWDAFLGKWLISSIDGGWSTDEIEIKSIDSQSITIDLYDEKFNGSIEVFTEIFNMEYVTGKKIGVDFPDDIPIYSVWLEFDEVYYGEGENIFFTPYGIYDIVSKVWGENQFGTKFEKIF